MFTGILIPLDSSVTAEQVIPYARTFARCLKLPVELLAVIDTGALLTSVDRARHRGVLCDGTAVFLEYADLVAGGDRARSGGPCAVGPDVAGAQFRHFGDRAVAATSAGSRNVPATRAARRPARGVGRRRAGGRQVRRSAARPFGARRVSGGGPAGRNRRFRRPSNREARLGDTAGRRRAGPPPPGGSKCTSGSLAC